MAQKYNTIVYIGRFSPFHNGHKAVIDHALTLANNVLVLVGSTNIARNIRNPFTYEERAEMMMNSLPASVKFKPVKDDLYNNNVWVQSVQTATALLTGKVALIGHKRDHTSFYLDMFPQWDYIEVDDFGGINATRIRESWYHDKNSIMMEEVPKPVMQFMMNFPCKEYDQLVKENNFINDYKQKWKAAPYAPTFVTVDAVMVHSGHILLVKRKAEPGKGLWALPGGFIGQTETLEDGCIRELREETRLKLPEKVIKGSQKGFKVFDHPDRSLRGRTITNAFYYNIETGELPKVKGDDDAEEAKWVPISKLNLMMNEFYEDHYFIISHFLGKGI